MSKEEVSRILELVLRTLTELLEEMDQTSEIVSRNSNVVRDNARLTIALLGRLVELERRIKAIERGEKN